MSFAEFRLAELKFAPLKFDSLKFEFPRFVAMKVVSNKLAPCKSAPLKSASLRSDPFNVACCKFALRRSTSHRFRSHSSALLPPSPPGSNHFSCSASIFLSSSSLIFLNVITHPCFKSWIPHQVRNDMLCRGNPRGCPSFGRPQGTAPTGQQKWGERKEGEQDCSNPSQPPLTPRGGAKVPPLKIRGG